MLHPVVPDDLLGWWQPLQAGAAAVPGHKLFYSRPCLQLGTTRHKQLAPPTLFRHLPPSVTAACIFLLCLYSALALDLQQSISEEARTQWQGLLFSGATVATCARTSCPPLCVRSTSSHLKPALRLTAPFLCSRHLLCKILGISLVFQGHSFSFS